jgi:hypothetical protein
MSSTRARPHRDTLRLLDPIRWTVDDAIDARLQADLTRCAAAIAGGIDYEAIERELVIACWSASDSSAASHIGSVRARSR